MSVIQCNCRNLSCVCSDGPPKPVPHKHAAVIKAWADGATIEVSLDKSEWRLCDPPHWIPQFDYRVKPIPKSNGQLLWEALNGNETAWKALSLRQDNYERYAEKFLAAIKEQE